MRPLTLPLIAAALLACAGRADAHAVLERAEPPPYRLVLKPPASLILFFSEPVDGWRTEVRVLDQEGRPIGLGSAQLSPERRQVRLPVRLPGPGIYTIAWRTLSLVDQHTYEGLYTITVGPLRPGAFTLRAGAPAGPSPWEVAARWLTFLGVAVLAGGSLLHRLFIPQALGTDLDALPPGWTEGLTARWSATAWAATTAIFVGSAVEMVLQAAQSASAAGQALLPSLLLIAGGEPARMSLALKAAVPAAILLLRRRSIPVVLALALIGLLPLGISLTGHAAAAGSVPLLLADWLHLTSAALWVGGLVYLAAILGPWLMRAAHEKRRGVLSALLPRFSNLALASVAVLLLTGAYATWANIPSVEAARATAYGRTLGIKLFLVIPLLALASVNLLSIRPQLAAQRPPTQDPSNQSLYRRFFRLARSEALLASGVLLAAAVLVLLPTSRQVRALTPLGQPFEFVRPSGDLVARVRVDPYQVGENSFELALPDENGTLVRDARVRFTFQPMLEQLGQATADATNQGNGRYVLSGPYIGTRGPWMMTVTTRQRGKEDAVFPFLVEPDWERGTPLSLPTEPAAVALLEHADRAMNRLRSMRQRQELTDGRGSNVATLSEFAAPSSMRFQVSSGMQGVIIGEKRYFGESGAWRSDVVVDTPFGFPRYMLARNAESVRLGPREIVDGSPAQVVVFVLKSVGAKARYAVWIDQKTGLILREAMAAPGHYMLARNHDFNAPVRITPPITR